MKNHNYWVDSEVKKTAIELTGADGQPGGSLTMAD